MEERLLALLRLALKYNANCLLLQEGDLEDYETVGIRVSVFRNSEGYELCYDSYRIRLFVYEKQIINFYVQKYY